MKQREIDTHFLVFFLVLRPLAEKFRKIFFLLNATFLLSILA